MNCEEYCVRGGLPSSLEMLLRRMWKFMGVSGQMRNRRHSSGSYKTAVDMAEKDGELRVFMVAGEVSGDIIGSRLMTSLKELSPFPVRFFGVGGSLMSKEGLKSLFLMEDISVMGMWELLPHLINVRVKLRKTIEAALGFRPHIVITVDIKGFSFRLLKQLRARYSEKMSNDPPVHFHYVAPSFWAWKGGEERLRGLAQFVDHVLCILPFEEQVCKSNGLSATFVGHPILEDILHFNSESVKEWKIDRNCEEFLSKNAIPAGATVMSVLPGSRLQEVTRMLPLYASATELLKESCPDLMTIIHVAPNQHVEQFINKAVSNWPAPARLVAGGSLRSRYDAFSASRVALCTSGTVALELQLARLPCVVAYRAHFLTEWLIRKKAMVSYMSLPNILLNSAVVPELLFQACRPESLESKIKELINNDNLRQEQIVSAEKVLKLLSPSERFIDSLAEDSLCSYPMVLPSHIAAAAILSFRRSARE